MCSCPAVKYVTINYLRYPVAMCMYVQSTGVKEMPPKRKSKSCPSSNAKRFATAPIYKCLSIHLCLFLEHLDGPFLKKSGLFRFLSTMQTVTGLLYSSSQLHTCKPKCNTFIACMCITMKNACRAATGL